MVYHMGSPAANAGKIITGSEDSGHRMRQFFSNQSSQNSLYNREAPFYARHPSIQEGGEEVRLSKFNFIGRQEQLISKYKKRLDREEKQLAYYNPRGNHSVEKPSRVSLYK